MATRDDEAAARSEILLRDAEEALAQERLREFWNAWGSTIMGMALMLIIGTGTGVAWREWRQSRDEASTVKLLNVIENDQVAMSDELGKGMNDGHAAIAWLSRAPSTTIKDLGPLYAKAAEAGKGDTWGWLARWNALRMRMDKKDEDVAKLLSDYEKLGNDAKGQALSSLAYTDAAVIAGEREGDATKALDYLAKAEKVVPRSTPMAVVIADLKHIYEIRSASAAPEDSKPEPEK